MERENTRKAKRRLLDAPKPVIERWARMRNLRWAQAVARFIVRQKLPWTERGRQKALEQAFETFKYYAIKHESGRFSATYELYNIGFNLLIAHRDIQAVKRDALTHPDEWTRKLHARIILLTVYEWDADKMSGRTLRKAFETMMIPNSLKKEAREALRNLRLVQRKVTTNFHFVRNATIAHRDPHALAQYRAIRDLKVDEVFAIAAEFFAGIQQFIVIHTKLMHAGSSTRSLLRQWMESES